MTTQKKWLLIATIVVYWLVLASSILAFAVLYLGAGMSPGNYNMKTGEALVFLTFPAALLGCKFLIYKLRGAQGGFKLLSLAAIIPLIQVLIVFVLI
jgi:hypothetical protein